MRVRSSRTAASCSGWVSRLAKIEAMALSVVSPPAASSRLQNALMSSSLIRTPSTSAAQSAESRSSPGAFRRSWMTGIMYSANSCRVRSPAAATSGSPARLPRKAMTVVYQPWKRSWSALSRPSMSAMTRTGKRVANASTRSASPVCRKVSISSRALRSMTGRNFSWRSVPRKAGATRALRTECSRPLSWRMVLPWTGSICQS